MFLWGGHGSIRAVNMSEREFHDWLTKRLQRVGERVIVGAGTDDCAHLQVADLTQLALSTDTIAENVHFRETDDPISIGWKAVTASVSDLAASGCRPLWALSALCLRRGLGDRWAMRLMEGIIAATQKYNMTLIGGDTTSVDGATSINITVAGTPLGNKPILRNGAKLDDAIIVTGELGGSLLGKHLRPEPRFIEIAKIIELVPVHACMDVSDGLTLDLYRLLSASNVGAEIDESEIPIAPAAKKMAVTSGKTPLEHALGDGEDFELLFTITENAWRDLQPEWTKTKIKTPLNKIGRITANQGIRLVARDGALQTIQPCGYEHPF